MQLANTNERWGAVAKFFHWTIVAGVLIQFALALSAHDLPLGRKRFEILALHKSIGITILALAVLRLLWRLLNEVPQLPGTLKPYERVLAHVTHFALYALLFLQPITGWLLSSASNFPVNWFGVLHLPDFVAPSRDLADTLHEVHENLARTIVAVAILHILGALKHHFVYKDTVLKRMTPFASIAALGVTALLAAASVRAAVPTYGVNLSGSKLGFVVTQSEGDVEGSFSKFKVDIAFAPEDLAHSKFDVVVDVSSVDTGDDERDTAIRDADLLDVARYSTARFVSTGFTHKSGNDYEGTGKLTLRGVTRDIRLPFTWEKAQDGGKSMTLKGATTVNRLDFGVGQGDWKDTDVVGNAVKVKYSLVLTPGSAAPSASTQPVLSEPPKKEK